MSEKTRILVVEDNDFVRAQIVGFLAGDGYETREATDGEDALGALEGVDLMILDLRMEPMGGFEFIKVMRGKGCDAPVVMVTGDDGADLFQKARSLGVESIMMKPIEKDRFLQTIERTLRNERRRQ